MFKVTNKFSLCCQAIDSYAVVIIEYVKNKLA